MNNNQSMTKPELIEFITALSKCCGSDKKKSWYGGLVEDIEAAFTPEPAEIIEDAKSLWQNGKKLEAVKLMCQYGYRLKDAKAYCEENFEKIVGENKELSDEEALKDKFKYAIMWMGSDLVGKVQRCVEITQQYTNSKLEDFVIDFLNWLTRDDSPYAIMYGRDDERFATIDEDLTSKQVYEIYLDSLKQQS